MIIKILEKYICFKISLNNSRLQQLIIKINIKITLIFIVTFLNYEVNFVGTCDDIISYL